VTRKLGLLFLREAGGAHDCAGAVAHARARCARVPFRTREIDEHVGDPQCGVDVGADAHARHAAEPFACVAPDRGAARDVDGSGERAGRISKHRLDQRLTHPAAAPAIAIRTAEVISS
jgi:hypothetical protein